MAGHGDGDMRHLPIAGSGIPREGRNAFLVGGYDTRRYLEFLPHHLPLALSFRHQYFAVRLGKCHHQRRLLARRDPRAFRQAGLDRREGRLVQINFPAKPDLQRCAPIQSKDRDQREAGCPAWALQVRNCDFGKKRKQSREKMDRVAKPTRTQNVWVTFSGQEFLFFVLIQVGDHLSGFNGAWIHKFGLSGEARVLPQTVSLLIELFNRRQILMRGFIGDCAQSNAEWGGIA
jgi:hypothetical protein